jgi:hypothetical protein
MRSPKASGERPDRAPLVLLDFLHASRDEFDAIANPRQRALAARVFEHTTFEVRCGAYGNRMLMTPKSRIHVETETRPDGRVRKIGTIDAPGRPLRFIDEWAPDVSTAWHVEYPVKDRDDLEALASIPWEPPDVLVPDALPEGFAERGLLRASTSSPMVCVSGAMPYQMFLELCLTDLPLVEELTELCRVRVLDCVERTLAATDADLLWIGGSEWVTPPMASPRVYDALVQEQERSIIGLVHAKSDAIVHVHCHGRIRHALGRTIERGGDYTEPCEPPPDGNIAMAEAKRLAAGRITLGGNIEARILANDGPDDIEAAVRAAFEGGADRMVLCPTERAARFDERESANFNRMIDVWEELSAVT